MALPKNVSHTKVLLRIARCIDGIAKDNLTNAEKQIAAILIETGFLEYNEHNELRLLR
jgi:hypothetical protein